VPSASASDGGAQAKFFYDHGGAQATTGTTLPPVLDVEFDPNGGKGTADPTACWKLSPAQSDAWITAFVREVRALTGRTPAIYTSKTYWQDCLGADRDFSGGALWVVDTTGARTPSLGFGGWSDWSLRQFAIGRQHGAFDYDEFHGSVAALQSFATH
jgi:GH25 family lysozyme M1 (1,4-beta-N-acetylmuramidase)